MRVLLTAVLMRSEGGSEKSHRDCPRQSRSEKCFTGSSFTKAYNARVDFSRLHFVPVNGTVQGLSITLLAELRPGS